MEYVLQTNALSKIYNGKRVVDKVSMHIKKGDIYGFIGKNGAGKSTLMRMVTGLASPDEGSLELFGNKNLNEERFRTGCIIENPALYPNMTGQQVLEYYRILFGLKNTSMNKDILNIVGLAEAGKKKTKNYSLGMKQRLAIGISLMGSPDFLILDEPINGLDPTGIKEIRELLIKLNQDMNMTILISSHILGELYKLANCYGIIHKGKLVEEFTKEELELRCRRCLKIKINEGDLKKATFILENDCKIEKFDVLEEGYIRIFEGLENSSIINMTLAKQDVLVESMEIVGQDLEEYFMELMGGKGND